ncbi:MAG: hypothetical protein PF904_05445 [Kiritimatiellae bacterium]|jgi:tetratricopeptide (TPR) repeat protein|nr:hypothetical protein [Kiritimatiellia bacterium]
MSRSAIWLTLKRLIACLSLLWAYGSYCAEKPSATATETVAILMRRGVSEENAGRTAEAVKTYTKLLTLDTTFEATVAPRLVALYVTLKDPAAALSWAARVARKHPAPQAYLAGVYARLGQWKESELLLRRAAHDEQVTDRRVTLLWQLAEVQENQSDGAAALKTLTDASRTSQTEALRNTSALRLDALRHRLAETRERQQPTRPEPQAEDTP